MLLKKIVQIHGKKIKTMKTGISDINTNISGIENNIGDLSSLTTTEKSNLVGAVNETHDVPLDIQELYKPLIAPLSVSLTGFVAGSYLYYGIPWGSELRVFIKVSKSTAMSGTTAVGTLPAGYRPTEAQTLTAYDTDGNVVSGITVTIGTNGAVAVVGSVDANAVVMASYNSSNPQSGMITKNDIEKLIAENLKDSGWQSATFATNVVATENYDKYRLIGNILYVNMVLTINEAINTSKILFTLPEEYRPARTHSFPCSIDNSTTTRTVQVTYEGKVRFDANGTPTGSGLMIYLDFCFPID